MLFVQSISFLTSILLCLATSASWAGAADLAKIAEMKNLACDVSGSSESCCDKLMRALIRVSEGNKDPRAVVPIATRRVELWHVYERLAFCHIRDFIQKRLERADEVEKMAGLPPLPPPK